MIAKEAFGDCEGLSQVTLPPTLAEIGAFAFSGCTSLAEIALPPALTEMGQHALTSCTERSHWGYPRGFARTMLRGGGASRAAHP